MKRNHTIYPFAKNDVVEVDIVDFGNDGAGVAKIDGVPIFIPCAIKGERVRAKIVAVKSSHAFAIVQQVLNASEFRTEPPCPYARTCGGCSLQHMRYSMQLQVKRAAATATVQKIAGISLPLDTVVPSLSPFGCRNKLSLPIRRTANGQTAIGFFRVRSHDVVDIEDCMMHTFPCRALLAACKDFMKRHKISAYSETEQSGQLRHLCVRVLQNTATVTLVGTQRNPHAFIPFVEVVQAIYGKTASLWYNHNPHDTNVIFGQEFTQLGGSEPLVTLDELQFPLHPAAFFQVNDSVRKELFDYVVRQAVTAVSRTDMPKTAIEAYAGQGVLAALLARHMTQVTAVERVSESVQAGERMKQLSGIENLRFIEGDCKDVLPQCTPPSVLVLDPPRTGLEGAVAEQVAKGAASTVLYISCNPASLARDLKILSTSYQVTAAVAFDMFAQTPNVELVVTLRKK